MAKILLMEDDLQLSAVVTEVLAFDGHEVTACASASAALEHIANERFDLLITDILVHVDGHSIPDGGISLITRLRSSLGRNAQPWAKDLPIIAISGAGQHNGLGDILKISRGLGADITLSKPTDMKDLLHSVNVLIRKKTS